jgi:hypothetical protein
LRTRFSDKKNTLAGAIDDTNKTWEGGWDLKAGTYKTVDAFNPEFNPPNTCGAWSSDPLSDDLEGQRTDDRKYHAVLKIRDGDEGARLAAGLGRG